jgi:hypothetical protein
MMRQLAAGTTLMLMSLALMAYTIYVLYGAPLLCAVVMGWLCFVQYAVGRAWWEDVQEVRAVRRADAARHADRHLAR